VTFELPPICRKMGEAHWVFKSMGLKIMFPTMVRLSLILVLAIATVAAFCLGNERWVLLLLAAVLLTFEHFRGGSIFLAYRAYRKKNIKKLRKHIEGTTKPAWLRPSAKAYYDFLKGVLAMADENFKLARDCLLLAAKGALRTDQMKCITHCLLADTSLELEEEESAKSYLAQARTFPHRDELNPIIQDLENRIEKVKKQSQETGGS
jgi:hypothetical protein